VGNFLFFQYDFIFINRSLKKAVELSPGGIKGVLLLFSDLRPYKWTTLFFKKIEACLSG